MTQQSAPGQADPHKISLRPPVAEDGAGVHKLITECPPLDTNSVYCNLLQCDHFAGTSVTAERSGRIVGFISGYRVPDRPHVLFVWQVAVSPRARGQKLASRMLQHILARPQNAGVTHIETTITKDNQASWSLFRRLARSFDAELKRNVKFCEEKHFNGQHETEYLATIGPLAQEHSIASMLSGQSRGHIRVPRYKPRLFHT
ncbi:diaminobutyrate acetyltransferase [Granulosicoccaceae sp. 1_MG-2023]|nr:diaminobutyrate acetyltransferase [Granulosicoccaceae sp. 1_MG-2023]